MSPKETLNDKRVFRARMRELSRQHARGDSTGHHMALLESPEWQSSRTVLIYDPLPSEVDLLPLIETSRTHRFLFPRREGEELCLHLYEEGLSWIITPLGFREPDPASWQNVSPGMVDLAVIPGLAFDPFGGRLGRGAGFYDRLLGRHDFRAFKVGVCWPWQLVESVPREAHDRLMDRVITGKN